jgi:hypothetical protein
MTNDERLQHDINKEMYTNLALSGGLQAAQLGATFIPTAQDVYSRQRLQALPGERAALLAQLQPNQLGYTEGERQLLQHAAMDPLAAQVTENRQRQEAATASMGNTTSARSQVQGQREANRALQGQAAQVGLQIEQGNIQRAQDQIAAIERKLTGIKDEQEGLLASKSQKAEQRIGLATDLLSQGAKQLGGLRGAKVLQSMDMSDVPEWAQKLAQQSMLAGNREEAIQIITLAKRTAEESALNLALGDVLREKAAKTGTP